MTLAELRGAPFPSTDALKALASSLTGFSDAVIDAACQKLETQPRGDYESPMPALATILDACRAATQMKPQAALYGIWRCESCRAEYGAKRAPKGGCQGCGHGVLLELTAPPAMPFDDAAYIRDVRANPQNYVKVSDVVREVIDRRRAKGLPVPAFFDQRAGDAA